jgi:hypothetical protein
MMLCQCKMYLNRFRIDHFKSMQRVVEIGLNSFIRLKKLRVEHLTTSAAVAAAESSPPRETTPGSCCSREAVSIDDIYKNFLE